MDPDLWLREHGFEPYATASLHPAPDLILVRQRGAKGGDTIDDLLGATRPGTIVRVNDPSDLALVFKRGSRTWFPPVGITDPTLLWLLVEEWT